jgi:hypothetical protein
MSDEITTQIQTPETQAAPADAEPPAGAAPPAAEAAPPPPEPPAGEMELRKLARERAAIQRQRDELGARQREIEEMRKQHSDVEELRALMARDPYAAAERMGLDYKKWSSEVLKGQRPAIDPIAPVVEKIGALEKMLQAEREERAKEREEHTRQQRLLGHADAVTKSGRHPLVASHDAAQVGQAIDAVIEDHYRTTGELLDPHGAADILEAKLQADLKRYQAALARTGSPAAAAAPAGSKPAPGTSKPPAGRAPTQRDGASTATEQHLTREERRARAMAQLAGSDD